MNVIKEYFNYMTNKTGIGWKTQYFGLTANIIIISSCVICWFYFMTWNDHRLEAERQNTLYEFEIIDKYDYIGSSFHLIGGRATEQEYHVVYKITPLTENAKKKLCESQEKDTEVSAGQYRKIKVGTKFRGHSDWFKSYY